ncbi:MAG TPA: flavin reductase, partial [Methylocella sp.]|nr:flavin reductase [Methylocella sp.]
FGQPASADKLAGMDWTSGRTGVPLLHESLAWFECAAEGEYPAGDHRLVLGKVIDARLLDPEAEPLLYRETGDMDGATTLFANLS